MKKLIILSFVILLTGNNFAQNVGIGTTNPKYILHVEAGAHNGIYARSNINNQDSAAIIGVLDLPTGANYRVAAIRGESKSTTDASIGVYGLQNGGGWGVAGSVKEAGVSGWGAGVFGEAGLNGLSSGTGGYGVYGLNSNTGGTGGYFADYNGLASSFALKTYGKLNFSGIGEANSKVLTSDVNGNATWGNLPGGANVWTVSGSNIYNSNTGYVGINTINPNYALHVTAKNKYGIYSTATVNGADTIAGIYGLAISPTPVPFSAGVRGESNSTNYNGIGVLGIHSGSGWGVAGFVKELGAAGYGAGVYGAAGSPLSGSGVGGYGIYGVNNNNGGAAGLFEDGNGSATSYALKTQGKLKLNGIGEANGKVLTSDVNGNATWGSLPGSASAWTVSGSNIYNSNTGFVGIGHNNPQYALDVRSNVKGSLFMENPIVNANATVRILRGIPESASYPTTALYVEASSDRAGRFIGGTGGIVATSNSLTGAGALLEGNSGSGIAVEIDGAIKVNTSATNKPFFTHITAAANITGNTTLLTYPNPASTDFVIVTSNWTAGPVYNNHPTGVYFTAGKWAIFNQDLVAMPVGTAFNVMVIRQ